MALILKQEANANVTTPPAGSGAVFLNTSDQLTVKDNAGNISTIPTFTSSGNTSVFFNDAGAFGQSANFTFVKTTNTLTVSGNVAATGVLTDNLYYANGNPWDLSDPGGSNTQIQFNDEESFGGSAAFTFNKSTNLVSMGGALSVTGNANVGNIGAAAGVYTANVTAANIYANSGTIGANLLTGTLTTASQPNITTVGTLTNLNVSGNAVISGNLTVDGTLVYVNVDTLAVEDPVISLGGGPNGAPLASNDGKDRGTLLNYFTTAPVYAFMGWDNSNGEFGFGSNVSIVNDVVTFTNLGNIRASTVIANVSATTVAGTLTTAAQPNITSVGTLSSLAVTANVTAGNVYANSGTIGASLLAGTLTTAAQPNVTSLGTLSSLSVTNNVSAGGVKTDNLYYSNGNPWDLQQPGGSNTQVQFNDADSFGGSAAFTFDKSSNLVAMTGALNVTGNANVGNLITPGVVSATGNVTGANLTTAGVVSATGNIGGGNINTSGVVSATGNVIGGNVTTTGLISATGNVSGGNLTTGGVVSAIGNVTGGNLTTTGALSVTGNANVGNIGAVNGVFTGNVSAGTINATGLANGSSNLAIPAANGNVNISAAGNANVFVVTGAGILTTGTVNAAGNINGHNLTTDGALSVTGNANVGNIGAAAGVFTANITTSSGNIYANSGTIGASLLTGTLTTASQPNITSVGTLTSAAVTGNVTAGNVYANSGTIGANVVNGNLLGGTLTTAAQPNVTSVGTLTSAAVTGNVTAGNVYANSGTIGAQTLKGDGGNISNIQGGNVSGAVASATTAGTVTTAAQPNITSVGTLTSLAVTGTATAGNLSTGGNLSVTGNAVISGNLTVDGNLVYVNVETLAIEDPIIQLQSGPNGAAPSSNTGKDVGTGLNYYDTQARIAFMGWDVSNAEFGMASQASIANDVVTFSSYGNLRVGNIIGNGQALTALTGANVTGQVANALVAGTVYTAAQPNITSVGTLSSLTVSGNASAGNLNTAGKVVASTLESNVATGTAPFVVASTTKVANLNADTLDGYDTATAATANTVVVRNADGNITGNNITGTLTTASQTNITSVGTLGSLAVTANVTAGNVYANSGTIGAQTLKGEGGNISNIQGANVSGTVSSATTAGTVTTAAQPNITSVGTLTSVSVTGNATAGNVYANSGTIGASLLTGTLTTAAQPNITSVGTLTSATVTGNVAAGNLTTTGVLSVTGTGQSSIAGNLDMTGNTIANLATPTNPTDAATKQYVDDIAQGLNIHDSVKAATPDTLANVTSGTITYNNGSNGVGAFLSTTGTFNLIDGVNVQTSGTRILVKNEANAVFNGIYTYTNTTAITRALDYDTVPEVEAGDFVFVTGGTLYDNTGWVQTSTVTAIGTAGNNIDFTQFSGAGTYNAGTGLTLSGTTFSISNTAVTAASYGNGDRVASFTVNSQGQLTAASNVVIAANAANLTGTTLASSIVTSSLTSVGTLGSLAVTGNATAGNVYANSGTIGALLLTGTLTTAAQPNITSVGTLTTLSVTGNVVAGNLLGTLTNGTSNVNIPTASGNINLSAAGTANVAIITGTGVNVSGTLNATGNANVGNIGATNGVFTNVSGNGANLSSITGANVTGQVGNALVAGTVYTAAQPNITSVGTLTSLSVTGNVTAGNIVAPLANGNSSVSIPAAAGNVNVSVNGTANVAVVTATGVNVAGTLNATGNANVGNIGATRGVFTNIAGEGGNISNIQGANVSGTVATATTAGTVTTAAQPNITSVGTLTSLGVSGAVTASTLVSNVATGTAPLTVTSTTRVSNLNVANAGFADSATSATNAAALLQNTSTSTTVYPTFTTSSANGNSQAVFNTSISANLGNASITATTFVGALSGAATTAGTVTTAAQPNITSVGTLTSLAVTGNITGGNLLGPHANGNSNVNIPAAAGNVNISVNGTANVAVVTATGVNVAGTLNATGAGTIGGDLGVSGNAVITGNLAVNGNLTYLNVDTLAVEDPIIQLQTGANGAAPVANSGKDVGTALNYYDSQARIAFMGWDVSNAEFGLASVATIASDVVTFSTYGNLRVGNIIGNGQALTGLAGGNVTGQVANALVAGTVYTAAQPNITSVGTLTSLGVSGAVTASTLTSNVATGTAPLTVTSTTRVANLNVAYANVADFISVADVNTGTFYPILANAATGNVSEGSNANLTFNAATGALNSTLLGGTLTTASQPNVTSVGTLTSLSVTGNVSGANVISSAYSIVSVGTGISAAGSTQGTGTALTKQFNVVSTVASGAGVVLPTAVAGMRISIINTSANALLVYPATNGIINSAAANAAYSQPAGARLDYISTTTTQWYTLNATYG